MNNADYIMFRSGIKQFAFRKSAEGSPIVLLQPEMERRPTRVILQLGRSLTMRKPRKNYTPVEKVAILRRHLIDRVPVSDLCDEHQLSPTLFYLWQKQFFEG